MWPYKVSEQAGISLRAQDHPAKGRTGDSNSGQTLGSSWRFSSPVGGDGPGELDLKRSRGRQEGGCQPRVSGAGRDQCKIPLRLGLIRKGILRGQAPQAWACLKAGGARSPPEEQGLLGATWGLTSWDHTGTPGACPSSRRGLRGLRTVGSAPLLSLSDPSSSQALPLPHSRHSLEGVHIKLNKNIKMYK